MRTLNLKKLLTTIVPSLYFVALLAVSAIGSDTVIVLISLGAIALIVANLFLQIKYVSQIVGALFLIGSAWLLLSIASDLFNDKANWGYFFGLLLALFSLVMAAMMIVGFEKKAKS